MTKNRTVHKVAMVLPRFFLLVFLVWLTGCAGRRLTALPQQFLGEWRTAEARYAGRSIKMDANRITFGMGGAGPDVMERVESVRVVKGTESEEYRINLLAPDGSRDALFLGFTQENGGELHLKNQPKIVWRAVKASSRAPVAAPQSPGTPQSPSLMPPLTETEHMTIYKIDCVHQHVCKSY